MTNHYKIHYVLTFLIFTGFTTLLMLSCGGCGSGKVANQANKNDLIKDNTNKVASEGDRQQLKQSDNSKISPERSSIYPIYDEERGITYLDEQAIEFQGVKQITNGPEIKIIFPNGKTLSNIKDAAIMKDVPKEAQVYYQSSEEDLFIKEVDLKKVSKAQRAKWFSRMKLHPDVKLSDLDYMIINSHMLDLDETPGRVCLAAYAEVWSEMGELVGRIAHLDIYDYEGKLIQQIPMYEYGGERFTVTKDQKYLLANVNGSRFGDSDFSCGLLNPQIRIFSFQDGQYFTKLNMSCAGWGFSGKESNFNFSTASLEGIIDIENKIVKIIKRNTEILNGGPSQKTDEGIITKDGRLWKYDTYTFEEWNKRFEPNFKEKQD